MATRVVISTHREYQILKVEINGREVFNGHRSDFLPFDLINVLKAVDDGHIEINQEELTGS